MHTITTDSLSASGNIEFHLNAPLDGLKAVPLTGKTYVVQDTFNCDFTIIGGPSAVAVFRNPERMSAGVGSTTRESSSPITTS